MPPVRLLTEAESPPALQSSNSSSQDHESGPLPFSVEAIYLELPSAEALVKTTPDSLLFNASWLYRKYFPRRRGSLWRIALRSFLVTPAIRGVFSILREHMTPHIDIPLIQRCDDVWLHTGFLPFALLDLRMVDKDALMQLHYEIRDIVADIAREYYSPDRRLIIPESELRDTMSDSVTRTFGTVVDLISKQDATELMPWMLTEHMRRRSVSPRTSSALEALSPVTNNPLLSDASLVPGMSLQIVYISLASFLAKKASLAQHCSVMGVTDEAILVRCRLLLHEMTTAPGENYDDHILDDSIDAMLSE